MSVRLESFGTPVVISRKVPVLPSKCKLKSVIWYEGAGSLRQIAMKFAIICPKRLCHVLWEAFSVRRNPQSAHFLFTWAVFLLWPDGGCCIAETCCLKVNDKFLSSWRIKAQLYVTLLFYFTSYVLNMFRILIYPSSGACDISVELPHWSYCSWFDVFWSFGVVGLEWYPCCRLKLQPSTRIPLQPNHTDNPTHIEPRYVQSQIHNNIVY